MNNNSKKTGQTIKIERLQFRAGEGVGENHRLKRGRKGDPKTAKPHRNTPKNRKLHWIFPEYRNRTYMEAHYR